MPDVVLSFSREEYAARLARVHSAMAAQELEDWGMEITESIIIKDNGPELLSNVPRQLIIKD